MRYFHQEVSTTTLSQFLLENEGERCVVVIDVRSQRFIALGKETLTMNDSAGDRKGRRT
jgi:hypothetical protein